MITIDFHGLIFYGYGYNSTDNVRGEYGTLLMEDLQRGLTALHRFTNIDTDRVVALGVSYGGSVINWIAGDP
jgi:dipeptidyl aminopeptidase/acylaminoacyl peptidase